MLKYQLKRFLQFHAQIRTQKTYHQFHLSPVSPYQDMSELLPAIHDTDENNWSGNNQCKKMPSVQHIKNMFGIENTAQNSSEQITTPDHPTDTKDIKKEDLISAAHKSHVSAGEHGSKSSEQITNPDHPTDIKDIRKEDLLLQICTHQKSSVTKHDEWDEKSSGQVSKNCIG